MRRFRLLALMPVLLLLSCGHYQETRETHIVHSGEPAVLVHPTRSAACGAVSHHDVHLLARAMDGGDEAAVRRLIADGKAIEIAANTRVQVRRESYNERQIVIEEGTHAGKLVWVPFEWLRPVPE
jgi:hypothetical protein